MRSKAGVWAKRCRTWSRALQDNELQETLFENDASNLDVPVTGDFSFDVAALRERPHQGTTINELRAGCQGEPNMGSIQSGLSNIIADPGAKKFLNSWKQIARYLGRGVRTVQRWEREFGLPIRRPRGRRRSAVIALTAELDAWLESHQHLITGPKTESEPRRTA